MTGSSESSVRLFGSGHRPDSQLDQILDDHVKIIDSEDDPVTVGDCKDSRPRPLSRDSHRLVSVLSTSLEPFDEIFCISALRAG